MKGDGVSQTVSIATPAKARGIGPLIVAKGYLKTADDIWFFARHIDPAWRRKTRSRNGATVFHC